MRERLSISNLESSVCVLNEWSEMTSEWLGKCNDQQSFRQFYVVGFISRQKKASHGRSLFSSSLRLRLERNAECTANCSGGDKVGSTESGFEIVQRLFVGQVYKGYMGRKLNVLGPRDIVAADT